MAEKHPNLWAPWRMDYIQSQDEPGGCFLCRYSERPQEDPANLVLWRDASTLVLLNRFPYNNGHLLVAPTLHCARLEDLPGDALQNLTQRLCQAQQTLRHALGADGFNIGLNLGRCAGAGVPDHLHWHIVPRWNGDTNFMAVIGDTRVIPESLQRVSEKFLESAAKLGIRMPVG